MSIERFCIESLSNALTTCYNNDNFKVGIVLFSSESYVLFINALRQQYNITSIPGVIRVNATTDNITRICFDNGSCIEVFAFRECVRGARFNDILYEDSIDVDVIHRCIMPMIYDYTPKYGAYTSFYKPENEREIDNSSEELDSFLGSFKIVPKLLCNAT